MAEIAQSAGVRRASIRDTDRAFAPASTVADGLTPLADIPQLHWRALSERTAEPNAYYLPDWEMAVNASARDRGGAFALSAWGEASQLIGLMPVVSLWRACKIPLPALVSADPYGSLSTPPIDRELAAEAAAGLLRQARGTGAHALILRDMSLDGAAMDSFASVLRRDGMQPRVLQSHVRASLDATRNADDLLQEALGNKKLKELRRQRNRLAELGAIRFGVSCESSDVAASLETFLELEASGWKGQRGTALDQHAGDAAFIRRATLALAESGQCQIATLHAGDMPVASAIVLRHQDRAFYFKLGVDERFFEIFAGRAADAGSDPAFLRRPVHTTGRFHRERGPSHDQPDLARPTGDRRRADPVAAARSDGRTDSCRARHAQDTPRAGAPPRPAHQETSGEILMNTATSVAPVIAADRDALRRDFPHRPFAMRHGLTGHPLLTLPRIAQLAAELPRDLIEYNSGKVAIGQDPDAIPAVDLDPVEVVRRIETAGAWMVLKRVEHSPDYLALLEDTLLSVARARGFNSLLDAGFEQVEGFLFVSSPNSTTPFHLDSEDNFFVHVHGEKFFTIMDNTDRSIVSDDEIERSMTKHRNLAYDESFAKKGREFHLLAGDGCYVPYQWPHWVRTADSFSISMAITWKTREVRRLNDLHFFNSMLRGIGLPQQPPGRQPVRDALKLAFYRTVTTAIRPLRASMAMRRVLRRIALGKQANYYLKGA